MRNEESGARRQHGAGPSALVDDGGEAFYRKPGVLAAGAALASLGLGIIIGRASVNAPDAREETRVESSLAMSSIKAPEAGRPRQQEPTDEFQVQFGRRMPKSGAAEGFVRDKVEGRPVARLDDRAAKLRFRLEARSADYALMAVFRLDRSKRAKLQGNLDGHSLEAWTLGEGWAMYSSPLAREWLATEEHELSFTLLDQPASAVVFADSVAIAPVGDQLALDMGPDAVNYFIDGFSRPEGSSIWSLGLRSSIGAVLAPKAAGYELRVRGSALLPLAPLLVRARVNDTDVGEAAFAAKVVTSTWVVPATALRQGLNRIEFSYPRTAQPAAFEPNSKDQRELALRFFNLALTPAP